MSDPFAAYKFRVDVSGFPFGGYNVVNGLDIDIDIEEVEEGGRNESALKLPGVAKPRPLRLRKGMTDAKQLEDWIKEVIQGLNSDNPAYKRAVTVAQLSDRNEVIRTWDIKNAFPAHYGAGPWNANDSGLTMEEITLYHDGWLV